MTSLDSTGNTTARRTGNTFRSILNSLHQASSGKTVKYFTSDIVMSKHLFKKASAICDLFEVELVSSVSKLELIFPSKGSVRFLGDDGARCSADIIIVDYERKGAKNHD